tara:strand:+ start:1004 stop:1255 length:252 start_codon:yes stop_codon:yes gene_type:complete
LLARENPFAREVDAEEEESNDPLAFTKSGFSSAVFVVVVFIIATIKKKQKLQLERAKQSREEKCRRIEFWPRLQSRFSLGIAS